MILDLEYYGSPWLRRRLKDVETIDDDVKQFIEDLKETLDAHNGLGIAASQVGRDYRIFLTKCPYKDEKGKWHDGEVKVYINPKILERSDEMACYDDGCLSIPGLYSQNIRPRKLVVEALDEHGKPFKITLEDFFAFNFCHEMDHLNGVLFIDRLDKKTRNKIKPELQRIKKKFAKG